MTCRRLPLWVPNFLSLPIPLTWVLANCLAAYTPPSSPPADSDRHCEALLVGLQFR
jgi:hypothetical protein